MHCNSVISPNPQVAYHLVILNIKALFGWVENSIVDK
jgi:hypothetical protein